MEETIEQKRERLQISFERILRLACRKIKPQTVLEWGPGYSTRVMFSELENRKIISLEHDQKWYDQFVNVMNPGYAKLDMADSMSKQSDYFIGKNLFEIHLLPITMQGGTSYGYSTWPLRARIRPQLIFVDGRSRVDCLTVAYHILEPGGVVILHDAHRPNYRIAWPLYKKHYYNAFERTVVLVKEPGEYDFSWAHKNI